MSKWVIFGIIVVVLGSASGAGFVFLTQSRDALPSLVGTKLETEETLGETKVYKDSSGFSFKYPEEVKVKDVTPEDDYSKLELTRVEESGKITISIKDTDSEDVDVWLAGDPQMKMAKVVGATTLGGFPAKQVSLNRGGQKLLATAAIDQNVIYLIDGTADGSYWEKVQNLIASSFVVGERPVSGSSSASDTGVIYEEEEVVE